MNAQFGLNGDNPGMPEDQKIENSEMIERVAKVIKDLEGCYDGCNHCKNIARKVIEVMREPTEEMKPFMAKNQMAYRRNVG